MAKKLSKKDMEKLKKQMGISDRKENRVLMPRPTVFYGKTNKQKRREGRMEAKMWW